MRLRSMMNIINTTFSDSYCRWTAWLNSDSGGTADKELLSALVSKYGAYACPKPSQIKVRRADTKQNATMKGGPQIYSSLDTTTGFLCMKSMQPDGSNCFDYEVQLCCPRKFHDGPFRGLQRIRDTLGGGAGGGVEAVSPNVTWGRGDLKSKIGLTYYLNGCLS